MTCTGPHTYTNIKSVHHQPVNQSTNVRKTIFKQLDKIKCVQSGTFTESIKHIKELMLSIHIYGLFCLS